MNVGSKIKALRLASDLTQEELANRARLTKGFISQLENEKFQTSISLDSLADILDALGISLSEFFDDTDETPVLYGPDDRIQVDGTGASSFELLVPGSTNNLMDPILVQLKAREKLEKKEPHSGEQFGYVLKGAITLILNKNKYQVSRNSCFYFKSNQPHQIVNSGDGEAAFLWVVSPPQM
ncbi:MAG: cupin domain-containing protein [Candidatus Zixiibacteriota bacterium]|nr:MAG: cupin domain-containing protein [candidate division Zixibacteria bacterium]